jgi:hypothetical protein
MMLTKTGSAAKAARKTERDRNRYGRIEPLTFPLDTIERRRL